MFGHKALHRGVRTEGRMSPSLRSSRDDRIDFVVTLPEELSYLIFSDLSARELCMCATVSPEWFRFAMDPLAWKRFVEVNFPDQIDILRVNPSIGKSLVSDNWRDTFRNLKDVKDLADSCVMTLEEIQRNMNEESSDSDQENDYDMSVPAIILDIGTRYVSAGFSGDIGPRAVFPNVVGAPKYMPVMVGMGDRELYVGDHAAAVRGILQLRHPVENGEIRAWSDLETVIHHTFYNELRVSPEEHPIVLVLHDNPNFRAFKSLERLTRMMFDTFSCAAVTIQRSCSAPLFYGDSGVSGAAMVVEVGAGLVETIPFYAGMPIIHAANSIKLGGATMDEYLRRVMFAYEYPCTSLAEMESVRKAREEIAVCVPKEEIQKAVDKERKTVHAERMAANASMTAPYFVEGCEDNMLWEVPGVEEVDFTYSDGVKASFTAADRIRLGELLFRPFEVLLCPERQMLSRLPYPDEGIPNVMLKTPAGHQSWRKVQAALKEMELEKKKEEEEADFIRHGPAGYRESIRQSIELALNKSSEKRSTACVDVEEKDIPTRIAEEPLEQYLEAKYSMGIHEMIVDSIMKCDPSLHSELISNIRVVGGLSRMKGFLDRLRVELQDELKRRMPRAGAKLKITSDYNTWSGISRMASSSNKLYWITKRDYDDSGVSMAKGLVYQPLFSQKQ